MEDRTLDSLPNRTSRRTRLIPWFAALIVVVLAGVALGAWRSAQEAALLTVPADWQTYRDPAGLFTLRMPVSWQVTQDGSGDFGNTRVGIDYPSKDWTFGVPDQTVQGGYVGPRLTVEVAPLTDSRHRNYLCTDAPLHGSPYRIGDLNAESIGLNGQLELYAQNAWFTLLPYYPGQPTVGSHPRGVPFPTPLPANLIQTYKQISATVVGSFRPIPDQALQCH
jgi:hypothetical protein